MSETGTVLDALNGACEYLQKASVESPRRNAEILLSELLSIKAHDMYTSRKMLMDGGTLEEYRGMVERRAAGEPLAYIVGNVDFMGLTLSVRKGVFIPRSETEQLCEIVLDRLADRESPLVADICTGCGAISLAIAGLLPDASCFATDASETAVACARENADALGLSDRVRFLEGHLADPIVALELEGEFDCVVANPPYVRDEDIDRLPAEIAEHEPLTALRGGADGTLFYPPLIEGAAVLLRPGGLLALEIDDRSADCVSQLAGAGGFTDTKVRCDLGRMCRFVTGLRM